MSIIAEALRKADKDSRKHRGTKDPSSEPSISQFEPSYSGHRTRSNNKVTPVAIIFVMFAVLFIGAGISYFFFRNHEQAAKPQSSYTTASDLTPFSKYLLMDAQNARTETPVEKNEPVQKMPVVEIEKMPVLSGIMFEADNTPLAVIDNQVMREGENLGNLKVLKITSNSADVEFNGTAHTLYIKR